MKKRTGLLLGLTMFLLFGLVGEMDYQEALDHERNYNEMVCKGLWGDYDNRKPDCSKLENNDDK